MKQADIASSLEKLHDTKRAREFRGVVVEHISKNVPSKKVAVLLSGGVDSHVALFGALLAHKKPHVYSFSLEGVDSRDFRTARRTASVLGLPFTHIELPTDIDALKRYVWDIHHKYMEGIYLSKTTVECCWPIMHAINAIEEANVLTGLGGDIPYCSSRSAKKQYLAGNYQEYLKMGLRLILKGRDAQTMFRNNYCEIEKKRLKFHSPLFAKEMLAVFSNFDPFVEGNKPIQKAVSRAAFWDFFKHPDIRVYGQQPFQKGDTGIETLFEQLLQTNWHIRGKTVRSVYSAVANHEVKL